MSYQITMFNQQHCAVVRPQSGLEKPLPQVQLYVQMVLQSLGY